MEKKALRKKYKEIRNSLEFLKCDVTDRVINCREYINADTVFSYISFNSEIDTEKINRRILEDKKILLVPCYIH